ncbi:MAG TPA: DNA-binding protein [Burkholderiaceae bacterium]|nr:DNA-binding protein [Burkholderiaceae bacterium]
MARSGLYKSDVKKARDALFAQGQHPSVDAVRIALGNTGSKTTIHKYLKELEAEEGDAGRKPSISEALQDLVERLAAQLQADAQVQIDAIRAEQADQARQHAEALAAARQELAQWRDNAQRADAVAQVEQAAHSGTREALQQETIARHTAEQQVADLKERLAANDAHLQSLEEKHKHARDTLEHYRQSVKEQREQDLRRHEQQVQQLQAELRQAQQTIVVKQEEVTRLNQEGARLIAELTHTRQALREAQEHVRQAMQRLDTLQNVEQRNHALTEQLATKAEQVQAMQEQLKTAGRGVSDLEGQVRKLELSLVQAQAKLDAQQGVATELRAFFDNKKRDDDG